MQNEEPEVLELFVKARVAMMCNIIHNGLLEVYIQKTAAQAFINRTDQDLIVKLMRYFQAAKPMVEEVIRRGTAEAEALKNAPKN